MNSLLSIEVTTQPGARRSRGRNRDTIHSRGNRNRGQRSRGRRREARRGLSSIDPARYIFYFHT